MYIKEKATISVIYYVSKWIKAHSVRASSFPLTSFTCFSVLFVFLYSKPFQNNYMHCEIIDIHIQYMKFKNIYELKHFFVKLQLKKNLKRFFGC